jgi:hypothetical protein
MARPRGSQPILLRSPFWVGARGRATTHSITLSTPASSVAGTSTPSAFAVSRLIHRSYCTGVCTGRSAGFAPFRPMLHSPQGAGDTKPAPAPNCAGSQPWPPIASTPDRSSRCLSGRRQISRSTNSSADPVACSPNHLQRSGQPSGHPRRWPSHRRRACAVDASFVGRRKRVISAGPIRRWPHIRTTPP